MAVSIAVPKPHLVYVLADDFGHNDVGWRHDGLPKNDTIQTPTLDALAAGGIKLNRYYAYQYCSPTRSSLVSGRYPIHVNRANRPSSKSGGVDMRMTTIGERMKAANYATSVAGKWHAGAYFEGQLPINRGFDASLTYLNGNEDHYTQYFGILKGTDLTMNGVPAYGLGNKGIYGGTMYTAHGVSAIETFARNRNRTAAEARAAARREGVDGRSGLSVAADFGAGADALFLFAPFQNTHSPMQVPAAYLDPGVTTTKDKRTYFGMAKHLDASVANLTAALKAANMWENTLLVFSADNGGETGGSGNNFPLRGGKYTNFEGGVRVVAFSAGGLVDAAARGTTTHELIHVCDMWTTFSHLAGVANAELGDVAAGDAVPPVDGVNVAAALTTLGGASTRTEVAIDLGAYVRGDLKLVADGGQDASKDYWTNAYYPAYSSNGSKAGVVKPTSAQACSAAAPCLFNVSADPREMENIAAANPGAVAALRARMQALAASAFQTGDDGYHPPNVTNCTTSTAFIAAHRGFIGPSCVACTNAASPACRPTPPPGPTPPTPTPPADLVTVMSATARRCLGTTGAGKLSQLTLVDCTDARARVWDVSSSAVAYKGDTSLCVRPTNPPTVPASCKTGTTLMIGKNACVAPGSSQKSGEVTLASAACSGLCVGDSDPPALIACDPATDPSHDHWIIMNGTL